MLDIGFYPGFRSSNIVPGAPDTADTTRLNSLDPYSLAVMVSRLIYPSKSVFWRPNAVILASTAYFHAAMAASSLVHFPLNGPVLLVYPWMLPPVTREEILRLQPAGEGIPAQVWIVGPAAPQVVGEIQGMGLKVLTISGRDPFELAARVAEVRLSIPHDNKSGQENVILVSGEDFAGGLATPAYAAHAGIPVLFFLNVGLPEPTIKILKEMKDPNVYVVTTDTWIIPEVIREIEKITKGDVQHIGGANPFEVAVNFAKFRKPADSFGWGRTEPGKGDAFSFAPVRWWPNAVVGSLLAHLGKHTPMLLVDTWQVPGVVKDYLLSLNPPLMEPPRPPFMHGFILGGLDQITFPTQIALEELLILRAEH